MSAQALRLTDSHDPAPRFERFAWERWLVASGWFAKLKPAETSVLFIMAMAADRQGESYWSAPRLAKATGFQDKNEECRAVRNARRQLVAMGLIELVSQGGGKRSNRYRIIMQQTQGTGTTGACGDDNEPDARSKTCSVLDHDRQVREDCGEEIPPRARSKTRRQSCEHDPGTTVPPQGPTGTYVPVTPEPAFHPPRNVGSGVTAHRTTQRTAAAAPSAQGAPDASLWESPPATAKAAAAALVDFGFSAREAAGIVSQHRPTAEQVRTVIANANAWAAAHLRGERGPLKLPQRFVAAQIAGKNFDPDPAVVAQRKRDSRTRQASATKSQAEQLDAAWDALGDAERERLRVVVLAEMQQADPRRAGYYAKARAQDEPIRSMIARASLNG